MTVQLPGGVYTVIVKGEAEGGQGTRRPGQVLVQVTGVPGRVRTNAQGVDIALDPVAWPAVRAPRDDAVVELRGPDVDGTLQTWVVRRAQFRSGNLAVLKPLEYVSVYAELRDTYEQTQQIPGG